MKRSLNSILSGMQGILNWHRRSLFCRGGLLSRIGNDIGDYFAQKTLTTRLAIYRQLNETFEKMLQQ